MPDPQTLTTQAAAEYLRGYAPAATSLADCYQKARAATVDDPVHSARVERAAALLGLIR